MSFNKLARFFSLAILFVSLATRAEQVQENQVADKDQAKQEQVAKPENVEEQESSTKELALIDEDTAKVVKQIKEELKIKTPELDKVHEDLKNDKRVIDLERALDLVKELAEVKDKLPEDIQEKLARFERDLYDVTKVTQVHSQKVEQDQVSKEDAVTEDEAAEVTTRSHRSLGSRRANRSYCNVRVRNCLTTNNLHVTGHSHLGTLSVAGTTNLGNVVIRPGSTLTITGAQIGGGIGTSSSFLLFSGEPLRFVRGTVEVAPGILPNIISGVGFLASLVNGNIRVTYAVPYPENSVPAVVISQSDGVTPIHVIDSDNEGFTLANLPVTGATVGFHVAGVIG